jgi:hypothetical protein
MVRGRDNDEDCSPLDIVSAAREAGIRPHILRKWLDRPEPRALLLRERRALRDLICSTNESALARIRNAGAAGTGNAAAAVKAIQVLEALGEQDIERHGRPQAQEPGVVIRIVSDRPMVDITSFDAPTREILPVPTPEPMWPFTRETPEPSPREEPIFRPPESARLRRRF